MPGSLTKLERDRYEIYLDLCESNPNTRYPFFWTTRVTEQGIILTSGLRDYMCALACEIDRLHGLK